MAQGMTLSQRLRLRLTATARCTQRAAAPTKGSAARRAAAGANHGAGVAHAVAEDVAGGARALPQARAAGLGRLAIASAFYLVISSLPLYEQGHFFYSDTVAVRA